MWESGTFSIDGVLFLYSAKVYEVGSAFGINGGKISKLSIYKDPLKEGYTVDNLILNYDRGWDIEPDPRDELERKALEYVLDLYPVS
jgi:hypothetical protein